MTARVYRSALGTAVRRALEQRAYAGVRVIVYAVILGTLGALWHAATQAMGPISGYDFRALLWYFVASELCVLPIESRLIERVGNDIGSGAISIEMLRPVSVVGFRIALELGDALGRAALMLPVGVLVGFLWVGSPPDLPAAALALISLPLAIAVNIATQYAFAASAFYVEDSKGAWFLYQKLVFLLGGLLLPLQVLPHWMGLTARALPLWAMAYVPARLLSGHFEPELIVIQVAWLVAMLLLARLAFSAGERRLAVVGG